jgi:hypothetical protein
MGRFVRPRPSVAPGQRVAAAAVDARHQTVGPQARADRTKTSAGIKTHATASPCRQRVVGISLLLRSTIWDNFRLVNNFFLETPAFHGDATSLRNLLEEDLFSLLLKVKRAALLRIFATPFVEPTVGSLNYK